MNHDRPLSFHATPHAARTSTEGDLAKRLRAEIKPVEQAREDAARLGDDPLALATHFRERVEVARSTEVAVVRMQALTVLTQSYDQAGTLVPTIEPAEAHHITRKTALALDRVHVERRKHTMAKIAEWQRAEMSFSTWCDVSGARRRHTPWPSWAMTIFILVLASFGELVATATILNGPAIEGLPTPYMLGLLFSGTSVGVGVLGAWGASWMGDKRHRDKWIGRIIVFCALLAWTVAAVFGAHMRGVIESGGTGTITEIIGSLHQGILRPFASPMALFLMGASALAAGVAWYDWLNHIGEPHGHRAKDNERLYAEQQLHNAEEEYRTEIRAVCASSLAELDRLQMDAWRPVNDSHRLEGEVALALGQAKECIAAIARVTRGMVTDYAATVRRLRPGIEVTPVTQLGPIDEEALGNDQAVHERVTTLSAAAGHIADAVTQAKIEVTELEVDQIRMIDGLCEPGSAAASSTPTAPPYAEARVA